MIKQPIDEESIRRSQAASKMSQTTTKSFKGETGYANKKYLNADLQLPIIQKPNLGPNIKAK